MQRRSETNAALPSEPHAERVHCPRSPGIVLFDKSKSSHYNHSEHVKLPMLAVRVSTSEYAVCLHVYFHDPAAPFSAVMEVCRRAGRAVVNPSRSSWTTSVVLSL